MTRWYNRGRPAAQGMRGDDDMVLARDVGGMNCGGTVRGALCVFIGTGWFARGHLASLSRTAPAGFLPCPGDSRDGDVDSMHESAVIVYGEERQMSITASMIASMCVIMPRLRNGRYEQMVLIRASMHTASLIHACCAPSPAMVRLCSDQDLNAPSPLFPGDNDRLSPRRVRFHLRSARATPSRTRPPFRATLPARAG